MEQLGRDSPASGSPFRESRCRRTIQAVLCTDPDVPIPRLSDRLRVPIRPASPVRHARWATGSPLPWFQSICWGCNQQQDKACGHKSELTGAIFACPGPTLAAPVKLSNLEQTAPQRYRNRVGTIVGLQFVHDILYMEVDRCLRDRELVGDLLIFVSFPD